MSVMEGSCQSHLDAPEEWPPVDLMQGAVIDIRGETVPPMFLAVCDQMFGTGHLSENERATSTPVPGMHVQLRYFEHQ